MSANMPGHLLLSILILTTFLAFVYGVRNEYDYVVVGAGSAGSVVANRLSEDLNNRVLLLEAGEYPKLVSEVPGLAAHLQLTDYDWKYKTVEQKESCRGFEEGRMNWPRGKVLGGSSILNYMIYVRGNKRDYDKWAEDGASGWSYEEVLPYFKKSEDNQISSLDKAYHGTGGEMGVEYSSFETPLVEAYIEAGKQMGYDIGDYNGVNQNVFSRLQLTTRNGRRDSTAKSFLEPILGRRNLDVVTSAFAKKIHFDDQKRATKVTFDHRNEEKSVKIVKEIIVSAGSINSPQLLMLSGIGPKDHLDKHKIPVVSDLPVGKNLQDHLATFAMSFVIDKPFTFLASRLSAGHIISYLKGEPGVMNTGGGAEAVGFVNTKYNKIKDWPDVELLFGSFSLASDGGAVVKKMLGLKDELFEKHFLPYANNDTITCLPLVQRTKSKGTITLNSADPYDYPIIDPKYISHPDDVKTIVEGMKLCLEWASTNAMKNLGAKPFDTEFPGCDQHKRFSDEYLECVARSMGQTLYHPLGTCKMGPASCRHTVVDPSLRVKGVHGVRVVDASIIPTMISGHINAATIMIGEKAADMILNDAHKHRMADEL